VSLWSRTKGLHKEIRNTELATQTEIRSNTNTSTSQTLTWELESQKDGSARKNAKME